MSERTERSEGRERMPSRHGMSERTERSEGRERMPSRAGWVVFTAMRAEARRLRRGLPPGAPVRRTGMGPEAARRAAERTGAWAVAGAGIAGGLTAALRPGDLVVATEVHGPDGAVLDCPTAPLLAAALRRRAGTVHLGPVLTSRHVVWRAAERDRLAGTGALVVDTESAAWLAGATGPRACVRAVADGPPYPLLRPGSLARLRAAMRALDAVGPALREWAAATSVRRVLLVAPDPAPVAEADLWLLPGPPGPGTAPMLAAASRARVSAHPVGDLAGIDLRWLAGARVVGVAAGPATPAGLVTGILAALRGLGAGEVLSQSTVPSTPRMEVIQ